MFEQLLKIDQDLFLQLNGCHSPFFDQLMWYASKPLVWTPLYLLLLYYCIRDYRKQTFYIVLFTALLVTITDQFALQLFKNIFCRIRPSNDPAIGSLVHVVNEYRGGGFSFVSSHAMNYFGLATFFTVIFWKKIKYLWLVAFAMAAVIAYSRIYLGVHYPGDVVCGALAGSLIGYGWGKLFLFLSGKYFSKHIKTAV